MPEDLKDILQQQCDRTSELEKQVLSLLAKEVEEAIAIYRQAIQITLNKQNNY